MLVKDTDILQRSNFDLGKNLHRNILRPRVYTVSKSLDNHFVRSQGKTISNKRLESKGILMVVDLIV